MSIAHVDMMGALAVTVFPFVLLDLGKIVCAALVARVVVRAVPTR